MAGTQRWLSRSALALAAAMRALRFFSAALRFASTAALRRGGRGGALLGLDPALDRGGLEHGGLAALGDLDRRRDLAAWASRTATTCVGVEVEVERLRRRGAPLLARDDLGHAHPGGGDDERRGDGRRQHRGDAAATGRPGCGYRRDAVASGVPGWR